MEVISVRHYLVESGSGASRDKIANFDLHSFYVTTCTRNEVEQAALSFNISCSQKKI